MNDPRAALLARVRTALGRDKSVPPPPLDTRAEMESIVRLVSPGADLLTRFTERAAATGMHVHRCSTPSLRASIDELLTTRSLTRVAVSTENPHVAATSTVNWRAAPNLDALYDADATITDIFAAIAETGTLVVRSAASTTRGGFVVAPIHIALVRASQIIPDLLDLWPLVRPIPTSLVLITGPSKTADIEGILITGVHGPKEVHIFLIEDA